MTHDALASIWTALGGEAEWTGLLRETGEGSLPSWFAVSDLAVASVGAAGLAVSEYLEARDGRRREVAVDRRLASLWFKGSVAPQGWEGPSVWDAIAGDYETRDGWIRLHTNAPHHRAAALAVLRVPPDRDAIARAVRGRDAEQLEAAILAEDGCAAQMRGEAAWAEHPQGQAVAREPLLRVEEPGEAGAIPAGATDTARPLHGLRVLDLTRVLAGPVATRFLAGFGATVLRIDPPDWNEPAAVLDVALGKSCARLDLKTDDGKARLRDLLSGADIVVHGYRPGALAGLGFDRETRQEIRPGLIDISLDAYGWTGPWYGRRGFDSLVQMSTGIAETGMRKSGADRPVPLPVQALDHATGYIMAAAAIRALTRRLATGSGTLSRASLARTAALLTGLPTTRPTDGFMPAGAGDFAEAIEETSWGPALRLRPPCFVEEARMRWDLPARDHGSAAPAWRA